MTVTDTNEGTINLEEWIEAVRDAVVRKGCTCGGGRLVHAGRPEPPKRWQRLMRKRPEPIIRFVHDDSCAIAVMMRAGLPPADEALFVMSNGDLVTSGDPDDAEEADR